MAHIVRVFDEDRRRYEEYVAIDVTGPRAEATLLPSDGRAERADARFAEARKYWDVGQRSERRHQERQA
jgi:hypothetical protein